MLLRLLSLAAVAASPAIAMELSFPVDCVRGQSCWIQQWPDLDTGAGASDFTCGSATYDGHDGTDIRLRTTADRATVRAAAAGVVKADRDGMPDRLIRTEEERASVRDRECGNGVVIDHGEGWETQYCHLRQGSIVVRPGERVASGAALGEVGYSGEAAFPHLHLSVRKDGQKIDPSSGALGQDCAAADTSLWSPEAAAQAAYKSADLLQLGFAEGPVDLTALEEATHRAIAPAAQSPALVAFTWLINLRKDDVITVTLEGPAGQVATNSLTLDRNKAQYLLFAGKKRPPQGWPTGRYLAKVNVTRQGRGIIAAEEPAQVQ